MTERQLNIAATYTGGCSIVNHVAIHKPHGTVLASLAWLGAIATCASQGAGCH